MCICCGFAGFPHSMKMDEKLRNERRMVPIRQKGKAISNSNSNNSQHRKHRLWAGFLQRFFVVVAACHPFLPSRASELELQAGKHEYQHNIKQTNLLYPQVKKEQKSTQKKKTT